MYQNYTPNIYQNYISTPLVTTNTNGNIINSSTNISIQEFFENLDKRFGDGVFSVYLEKFLDQCIEIQHIPELGDEEFKSLGITKIGHKKTLIMEAKKYS
jgi:SAM domain (Sterile alpha motif)